ncbi:class I SAM-dependent methyltransferase [Aeromicrobium terrae]|uniref:Class I SAM-dependent methyltransferase n=1 Tax=Aeromicrobium terrae TaxID=2498846 RepID=A0A5C8NH27_9ACTN|nr:class I SAM-dependent methyltransferase [Aeromicrobium terrae]TXL57446.1 class I SAM-dependent methyltransferase [Aeromicrobium terrae]
MTDEKPSKKVADQYDRGYDYTKYWDNRDYEHAAEEIAIRRLLDGRHFGRAADVGGGFGRLCLLLREYADHVTLAEPSLTQLEAAKKVLAGTDVEQIQMQADDLQFDDASLDLLTMVRVMHHIPEPSAEFAEIARVLKPGATALIEVANYGHFKNRRRYKKEGKPLPTEPVSIRTAPADEPDAIAFVNHNIDTVVGQLSSAGLHLVDKLSVSNLRSERLKKMLPMSVMLAAEKAAQRRLASRDFGPSIFLELRKNGS